MPKISIITPSFNQGQYIEQTILSVINQDYPDLEYIIIDGGSTDDTVDIIKKYQDHITYWVSEKDQGQSDAINKGLKKATGEIVAWLNSDDYYTEGTLKCVGERFAANPDVSLVYGNVIDYYPDGKQEYVENKFDIYDFMSRVSMHQPGLFWKRKIHDEQGYLKVSHHYLMDYDLWIRIFLNYKTLSEDKVFCMFRRHKESKTNYSPYRMFLEYRMILSRFFNSINRQDLVDRLKELGVYLNPDNEFYKISYPFTSEALKVIFDNYVFECMFQEYTYGHFWATNKLIFHNLNKHRLREKLTLLAKNNFGGPIIRRLRPTKWI